MSPRHSSAATNPAGPGRAAITAGKGPPVPAEVVAMSASFLLLVTAAAIVGFVAARAVERRKARTESSA